ncbi:hypothetical protein KP509_31G009700 [Ceratopteris richardii]|uniref:C2 domain-containing protein n=1 Tax=Ceratopteris richardii TaxID=49495 RepID=A0A8T2QVP7_CERRI|nr:hypothetical protein KP509_31G009700 [Ceratopteris richardii]
MNMSQLGLVEVHLIGGKGMKNVDFLGENDPYAILAYKTQKQKSKTLEGGGSNPVWKQKFYFKVDEEIDDVVIQVFDEDERTADDAIGEARIPLSQVLEELEVPATFYDLKQSSGKVCGQVEVALKFISKEEDLPHMPGAKNGHYVSHAHVDGPYGEDNGGGWQ